jgi:hypothetical protein
LRLSTLWPLLQSKKESSFLKKRSKKLSLAVADHLPWCATALPIRRALRFGGITATANQSFLLLFFKKEVLAYHLPLLGV